MVQRPEERSSEQDLKERWQAQWTTALRLWSPYIQLREPLWCWSEEEEKRAGLSGSFAMIRLVDHLVVISLRQIEQQGLGEFSCEILAHEIGHHVLCPADLTDNARLLSRVRLGLPGVSEYAPMVSNLYSDLLINDRLARNDQLDMAGVYDRIKTAGVSTLWLLYMRIYEHLWRLPPQSLALGTIDERLNQDAQLGARLIRSYARDWMGGGGRFACLCFPYVERDKEAAERVFRLWSDAVKAGAGGFPNGLCEIDEDEEDGVLHPAEDPKLSGLGEVDVSEENGGRVRGRDSGVKTHKTGRSPFEYNELLQATGMELSLREVTSRYYKERALPHLIPFPARAVQPLSDPLPEGLEGWDVSEPLEHIDWLSTLLQSPEVVPGVTTRQRLMGDSPGSSPDPEPLDLYLGVDCSGSMGDPAHYLSYPILAGAIMVLSALRAGARVQVVLSGEPGQSISSQGFSRDEQALLRLMTNYLGTGYAFGIHRLAETFAGDKPETPQRPVHVLIISDADMFRMLDEYGSGQLGWDIARQAAEKCGGGATYVLQIRENYRAERQPHLERMQAAGWGVHLVDSMEELLQFARNFSRTKWYQAAVGNATIPGR